MNKEVNLKVHNALQHWEVLWIFWARKKQSLLLERGYSELEDRLKLEKTKFAPLVHLLCLYHPLSLLFMIFFLDNII